MRLEVFKSEETIDVSRWGETERRYQAGIVNWHCRIWGGSDITFSAGGYNSATIALTALCNHMIACEAFLRGTSVKAVLKDRKQEIRAMVRAQVKVLA